MAKDTKYTDNPHKNHRKRLKDKFLEFGIDALEDHEFLELILYYAIPMKNTNDMAHDLVSEFGEFKDILEADIENLKKIDGISEHAALLFKVILAAVNKYINNVSNIAEARLTPENINFYIKNLFYGETEETAYLLLLDKKCIVRKLRKISRGTITSAKVCPREIVKIAVNDRYPYVMLAHNHPGGSPIPSKADLYTTRMIEQALLYVDVRLVDHVIVSGERVISLAKHFNFLGK